MIKWASAIASPVISILYNEDYNLTKMSGAFVVFKTLIESGKDEAGKKYDEITNTQQAKYYFSKREFEFFEDLLNENSMGKQAVEYRKITRES